MEGRWLHGAAFHGCALVAETSCEMRNEYLDRALVVPVLGESEAAFCFAAALNLPGPRPPPEPDGGPRVELPRACCPTR